MSKNDQIIPPTAFLIPSAAAFSASASFTRDCTRSRTSSCLKIKLIFFLFSIHLCYWFSIGKYQFAIATSWCWYSTGTRTVPANFKCPINRGLELSAREGSFERTFTIAHFLLLLLPLPLVSIDPLAVSLPFSVVSFSLSYSLGKFTKF